VRSDTRVGFRLVAILLCFVCVVLESPPAIADSVRSQEWILPALGVAQAQRLATGKGVIVAVIDTGVAANQVDLRGNILLGVDLTSGVPRSTGNIDTDGHGTSMAGLIAGHGHGSQDMDGILGIAPLAKVLPIRVSRASAGNFGSAGQAVTWAVSHGANVISLAFGSNTRDEATASAMLAAFNANVVLVAAAGNINQGDRNVQYPAAYPGVVAVAGTDEHGNHSKVSVTGNLITIAAPSDNIPSTYKDGGYAIGSGTSSSTAIVAGAAALVRSRFPSLTAGEVVNRLTATAIDKGPPGRDDEYGYGLINLIGALTAKVPPAGSTTPSPSAASPTSTAPTAQHNPTPTAITPPSRSNSPLVVSLVAVLIVLLAVSAAWTLVRRRRPG
jgi:type VII secretion-associated serine protease mycosin